jgi:hypothetical protein
MYAYFGTLARTVLTSFAARRYRTSQLICSSVPPWPTAAQSVALAQLTPVNCLGLPPAATWLVQVVPPSAVVSSVPWSPTAAQNLVVGQLTPRSASPSHGAKPVAQPRVIAMMSSAGEFSPLRTSSKPDV